MGTLLVAALAAGGALPLAEPAAAQDARVRAVLFHSPTCGHCFKVMTQDLPPLKERYGDRLEILTIDATTDEGHDLFVMALDRFGVPRERSGVPLLVVGTEVLSGSTEIPERFPTIIEEGLAAGGIDWPALPLMMRTFAQGAFDAATAPGNATRPEGDGRPTRRQIGLVIGIIGALALLVAEGVHVYRRQQRKNAAQTAAGTEGADPEPAVREG